HLKKIPSKDESTMIDLDGGGPLQPFKVKCTTAVKSKTEEEGSIEDTDDRTMLDYFSLSSNGKLVKEPNVVVSGEVEPGAVKKELIYQIGENELDRFVEGFESCRQYMRFECKGGAKLMTFNNERRPSTWYATRNGQHGLQWADAPPYSRMCSCAMNTSCIHHS